MAGAAITSDYYTVRDGLSMPVPDVGQLNMSISDINGTMYLYVRNADGDYFKIEIPSA